MKRSKVLKRKHRKQDTSKCFYFHPEDELLETTAREHIVRFEFSNKSPPEVADSKRAFYDVGIEAKVSLHILIIP